MWCHSNYFSVIPTFGQIFYHKAHYGPIGSTILTVQFYRDFTMMYDIQKTVSFEFSHCLTLQLKHNVSEDQSAFALWWGLRKSIYSGGPLRKSYFQSLGSVTERSTTVDAFPDFCHLRMDEELASETLYSRQWTKSKRRAFLITLVLQMSSTNKQLTRIWHRTHW
jgi:hypothetical protein